jgi:ribosomal protein L40E
MVSGNVKEAHNMNTLACQSCGAENPAQVNFCKQCGSKLEGGAPAAEPTMATTTRTQTASSWPHVPVSTSQTAESDFQVEKRYAVLHGIAFLCHILAFMFAGVVILSGAFWVFILLSDEPIWIAFASAIGTLISAAITYIFWRIIGESISVLLDIEENTRQTAFLLRRQQ